MQSLETPTDCKAARILHLPIRFLTGGLVSQVFDTSKEESGVCMEPFKFMNWHSEIDTYVIFFFS